MNGERDISLSFSLSDVNTAFLEDIETGWQVNFQGDWYHLYSPKEDMHGTKSFDADLDFFHHFSGFWHVDDAENRSMTIDNSIPPLFVGTDYVLNIIDNFYANTMSYSKQQSSAERFLYFIGRHNAEFNIPIGTKTVQVRNRIGVRRNDIIIHEDDNVIDLQVDTDTSSFCTAIEYYYDFQETDDEGSEKEPRESDVYISPMSDKYGVYYGEPVYDERYSDKNSAREAARLKQESTFKISFTLQAALFNVALNEGDEVRLVYPSKSINMYIRVVEINEDFDEDGDLIGAEYTFGNENISAEYRNRQYDAVRDVDDLFRGKGSLDYNVLPKAVREATAVINAGESSSFEYRRNGIYGFNTENPLGVTRYNANGIGFSQDGGQTFENALTYLGLTASAITTGSMTANRIHGGVLTSINSNTTFNLNTGKLQMSNADFELGGGANIHLLDAGNRVYYQRQDSQGSQMRSAGVGFGRSINERFPFAYLGTSDSSRPHAADDFDFTGFITNTLERSKVDGIGNSAVGNIFHVRDKSVSFSRGYLFSLESSYEVDSYFSPINTGSHSYHLGRPNNRWDETYLANEPNVFSDERHKTGFKPIDKASEIIERLEARQFRYKLTNNDLIKKSKGLMPRGVKPSLYGFSAQQVKETLDDLGVTDQTVVEVDSEGGYGLKTGQIIPLLVAHVQTLSKRIEVLENAERADDTE